MRGQGGEPSFNDFIIPRESAREESASVKWDNSHEPDPGIKILSGGSVAIFGEEGRGVLRTSGQDPIALPVVPRGLRVGEGGRGERGAQ